MVFEGLLCGSAAAARLSHLSQLSVRQSSHVMIVFTHYLLKNMFFLVWFFFTGVIVELVVFYDLTVSSRRDQWGVSGLGLQLRQDFSPCEEN